MVANDMVLGGESYEFESVLGEGQFGIVYKCRKESTGTVVAIKKNEDPERCWTEARILNMLRHPDYAPYFVQCIKFHNTNMGLYLVMEYCSNGSLEQFVQRNGSCDNSTAIHHFVHLARGLDIMHGMRLLHRDLKPANILVSRNNAKGINMKIADFGISKEFFSDFATYQTPFGNRCYMAPEVLEHHRYDKSADIYSLGAVIYFMTRGRHPWGLRFDQCGYPIFRDRPRGHGHKSIVGQMMCQRREGRLKLADITLWNDNCFHFTRTRYCDMCGRKLG